MQARTMQAGAMRTRTMQSADDAARTTPAQTTRARPGAKDICEADTTEYDESNAGEGPD